MRCKVDFWDGSKRVQNTQTILVDIEVEDEDNQDELDRALIKSISEQTGIFTQHIRLGSCTPCN